MVAYSNVAGKRVISYSKLEDFHSCPRKYELLNILHANPLSGGEDNIDFMFGHAVGTGVQLLAAGLDETEALFYAAMEWKTDIFACPPRKKKSFAFALHAVSLAKQYVMPNLKDYEIFEWNNLEGEARSGIESYFRFEADDGKTIYEGHIDLLMIHKVTRKLTVFEIKTNAFSMIHDATYANSYQVDGYSMFCALMQERYGEEYNIAPADIVQVNYVIFKVPAQEYEFMPIQKSVRHWLKFWRDMQSDIEVLDKYEQESNFPKRGGACYDYFRPCHFFGTCHYPNHRFANYGTRFSDAEEEPESFSAAEINNLFSSARIVDTIPADAGVVNPVIENTSGLTATDL